MRISDWSSDVCSSDLNTDFGDSQFRFSTTDEAQTLRADQRPRDQIAQHRAKPQSSEQYNESQGDAQQYDAFSQQNISRAGCLYQLRSEEHTSELQSLMRISYAVFCLKKKTN